MNALNNLKSAEHAADMAIAAYDRHIFAFSTSKEFSEKADTLAWAAADAIRSAIVASKRAGRSGSYYAELLPQFVAWSGGLS